MAAEVARTRGGRRATAQAATVALVVGAVGASAVWARLLSRDLMSPAWAVIGVVAATGLVAWSLGRRQQCFSVAAIGVVAAGCGVASWAAWVPPAAVLPEPGLLDTIHDNADVAAAQAAAAWATIGPGSCVAASTVDLGLVGAAGLWEQVCASGRTPDEAHLTFTPVDPGALTIVYGGGGPGIPGACARAVAELWWAVAPTDLTTASDPCPRGFTYQGAG